MHRLFKLAIPLAMLAALAPLNASRAAEPLVGTWRTIDGQTNQPTSLVSMSKQGDGYSGKIVQVFEQGAQIQGAQMKCVACTDSLKDAPVVGLVIVENVKPAGDNKFGGGKILDPKTGKTYDLQMTVTDGGRKLKVLAYVGLPAFGQTVVWERAEP